MPTVRMIKIVSPLEFRSQTVTGTKFETIRQVVPESPDKLSSLLISQI